jgi:hypothetical protein
MASRSPFTVFSRALYELNIDGICANTPAAKGRVERAHLTLQDRLVKEFRLAGVSSIEAANALMPSFIEAYNSKFAKLPRNTHDAHRALRPEEDLDLILTWRELRKVTQNLLLHYERKLYVLVDTPANRRLIGKYVEVFQYPQGRIEIRVAGRALPYSLYTNSGPIDHQGAIVENKRLSHALQVLQEAQACRRLLITVTFHLGRRESGIRRLDAARGLKIAVTDFALKLMGLREIPCQ